MKTKQFVLFATLPLAFLLGAATSLAQTTGGSTTSGGTTSGTTSGCVPITCAELGIAYACDVLEDGGLLGDGCGSLLECACDAGLPQCTANQPVPCSTSDGQFCCARSQPYCCPGFACSSEPSCGSTASTTGTSGGTSSGTTSGSSSTSGTSGARDGGNDGGADGGNTQTECPADQPYHCAAYDYSDAGIFCSDDPSCGQILPPVYWGNGGRYGGCGCNATQAGNLSGGALALAGLILLRRRRMRR
jgi:MYXO-CTERM domain-containing protein